jgi:hypothetical protein
MSEYSDSYECFNTMCECYDPLCDNKCFNSGSDY